MRNDVLAKEGDIYNLSAGDPNLDLSLGFLDVFETLDINQCHNYDNSQGNLILRRKLFPMAPDKIVVSNGAKQLIYMSLLSTTKTGDEIVIIGPCWSSYYSICEILGLKVKSVIGTSDNKYVPTLEDVEKSITPETSAVLFNNPNNPTGVVYSKLFIDNLMNCCDKNHCWLISDEIYKDYVYEHKFYSLKDYLYKNNIIIIDGFSKSYGITGWRLGYAICNDAELINAITAFQSQISGPPNTLVQKIVTEAFDKITPLPLDIFEKRRNVLRSINEKFNFYTPDAGFYYYIPINERWNSSKELVDFLLKNFNIMLTEGDGYGVPKTVRISFANITEEELLDIKTALDFV